MAGAFGSPQPGGGPRAFAVQYTSLVLILLTFTIGAFGAPARPEPAEPPEAPAEIPGGTVMARMRPLGGLRMNSLFERDTVEVNPDAADALAGVLSNHDVKVTITIYHLAREVNFGVARASSLAQALAARGIPVSAAEIFAAEGDSDAVEVTFGKEDR